jgi:hypothetical protein
MQHPLYNQSNKYFILIIIWNINNYQIDFGDNILNNMRKWNGPISSKWIPII